MVYLVIVKVELIILMAEGEIILMAELVNVT